MHMSEQVVILYHNLARSILTLLQIFFHLNHNTFLSSFHSPGIHRQGTNNAYANNLEKIQKGHLVPASTYSFDCLSMVSTFRYTNAVPQYAKFNMGRWKDYEDWVRKFAKDGCSFTNGDLYLLTGTSEAVLKQGGAVKQELKFFPKNQPNEKANIAIPNSMWTAGCCIIRGAGAFGGFAAIGNNVQVNPEMHQVTVKELETILAKGIGRPGAAIKLFPGNDRCSAPSNQFRYVDGQWTKAIELM